MGKGKLGLTTLCYIEKDEKYLMLHRIVKKNDINKDKWIGVGGHFEPGESPEECMFREVMEETGLNVTEFCFCGIVTFVSDQGTDKEDIEYMFLYHIEGFEGELKECDEGVLEWIPKKELLNLELWEGDRLFLRYMDERKEFFSLKLVYVKGELREAILNGKNLEFFDVLLENGEPSGRIKERSLVHEDGDLHRASHIWIARETEAGYELLLQRRSYNKDSYPGCFDISSAGHVSAGMGYTESAIRELSEELGIHATEQDLHFIGYLQEYMKDIFYEKPFLNYEKAGIYLYEKPVDIHELVLQKEEVEEVIWLDIDKCIEYTENKNPEYCLTMKELQMVWDCLKNKK